MCRHLAIKSIWGISSRILYCIALSFFFFFGSVYFYNLGVTLEDCDGKHTGRNPGFDRVLASVEDTLLGDILSEDVLLEDILLEDV